MHSLLHCELAQQLAAEKTQFAVSDMDRASGRRRVVPRGRSRRTRVGIGPIRRVAFWIIAHAIAGPGDGARGDQR